MKKLILFFSLLLFFFQYTLRSQNADSLVQSLNKSTVDTDRIKIYIRIVKFYNSTEPLKAPPFAIELTKLAEKVNIEKFLTSAYNQLGITYYFLSNTNQSAELFLRVLKITEKNNDSLGISRSLNNIGLAYHDDKAYAKSLEYLKQSLAIKIKLKDYLTLWTTYMNIGLSYSSLNEYDKALESYFSGLEAWKLLKEEKNESYASIMSEIGVIYEITDSLDKAERYLNEAAVYYEKSKNYFRDANTLLHLAIVNRKKSNTFISHNYLNKTLGYIRKSGAISILPDYYLELSNLEESRGNLKNAFADYKRQQVLRDSLDNKQNLNDMNRIQEMYRIEQQEAETTVLKKEIELGEGKLERNKIITIGVITLLAVVLIFYLYLIRIIDRLKIANAKLNDQQKTISKVNGELRQQKDDLQILANELKKLNADKDRFMAILGHDLKSPFNVLLGLSDMLTENIRVFPLPELEDIAINLNKAARNTYNLLEDILLWTRAQSGKIPFKPQKLNFSDICREILDIFNPVAGTKGIKINYSEANEVHIFGDLDMIKTVMRNLVSNAVKFTKNDGTIKIDIRKTESWITISVEDNGVGIEQENLSKLFKNTEVITTTGTANEKGTGLGLLLCKEFIEKHNGKIWVESEPGTGSKFNFNLPVKTDQ